MQNIRYHVDSVIVGKIFFYILYCNSDHYLDFIFYPAGTN